MEGTHKIDGIVKEVKHVDARIVDSPLGYKIIVPIFNEAVPSYYKDNVMETVRAFVDAYSISYGIKLEPEDIYVDGNLSVCLDRKIPMDKKYRLYIVIVLEEGCRAEPQDYVIEVPVLPTDEHFAEFRQCFLDTFEAMVGDR